MLAEYGRPRHLPFGPRGSMVSGRQRNRSADAPSLVRLVPPSLDLSHSAFPPSSRENAEIMPQASSPESRESLDHNTHAHSADAVPIEASSSTTTRKPLRARCIIAGRDASSPVLSDGPPRRPLPRRSADDGVHRHPLVQMLMPSRGNRPPEVVLEVLEACRADPMVVVAWLLVGAAGRARADVSSSSIGRAMLSLQSHTIHTIEPIDADVHLAAAVVGEERRPRPAGSSAGYAPLPASKIHAVKHATWKRSMRPPDRSASRSISAEVISRSQTEHLNPVPCPAHVR